MHLQTDDPYSGDHGLGFFGHAMNVGAYVAHDATLGWRCYLCALMPATGPSGSSEPYSLTPLDSFKKRAYIGPLGLWVVLQTGTLLSLQMNPAARTATLTVVDPVGSTATSSTGRGAADAAPTAASGGGGTDTGAPASPRRSSPAHL